MSMSLSKSLARDGFVKVPGLLSPAEVETLAAHAAHATALTRSGGWPHLRAVPKQFPPWPTTAPAADEGGIWGVQHLLHPDMPGREVFAGVYFAPKVLSIVEQLVASNGDGDNDSGAAAGRGDLVMELFNLLVAPEKRAFELRWHRDDIPDSLSPAEEWQQLQSKSPGGRQSHAQYNLALRADSSLVVVPGSHRRVRTAVERQADPYAASLPGQLVVDLQPGDAVFYDSNILHRGVYAAKGDGETRLTLHGSVGLATAPAAAAAAASAAAPQRARAVLQHGVGAWVHRADAAFAGDARAERMRANLVAMGSGEGVGYSLQG